MTTISSVILVDKRIQDHETIVAAIKADGVRAIVFDVADIDAQGGASSASSSSSSSFEYILDKIADLGATSFSNIGIVQHNTGAPFHRFFAETKGEESTVAAVETADPTLQTWAGFAAFVTTLKTTYGVQNVDLMACALYSDPNWKYVIDTLVAQTGVTIRASTDDTGAAALGGDWFLESHTGVNLKDVYFTEAIEEFRGMLNLINTYDSRSYSTKSFAPGRAFAWGTDTQGGDTSMNITGGSLASNIIALYGTQTSIAALRTDGSVVTWGSHDSGGLQRVWSGGAAGNVAGSLTSGVTKVYTNVYGMAALKTNGAVITWGLHTSGGNSSTVSNDLSINVVDVFTGEHTLFAALKSNGGLVTWGTFYNGTNDTTAVSSLLSSGVVTACLSRHSAAALKNTGRVITWPSTSGYGGNSSSVAADISAGVVALYSDYENTFAVLRNNNTVVTWGYTTGMSPLPTSVNLNNVVSVYNTYNAYAVLKLDGSVVTWGGSPTGGDSNFPSTTSLSTAKVVTICSNSYAFAALTSTGNVITWGGSTSGSSGGNSSSVSASLTNVVAIYSTTSAFAALKNNGQVITWGGSGSGGTSTSVSNDISANVVAVYSNQNAFTAVRKDGRAVIWGGGGVFNVTISTGGTKAVIGGDLNSGIVSINKTYTSFAAIQSTATTFDLSASYYTDNDRYDILRNKENRRRVNLTTLNNNVFTLSSARDIERFNYTIPTGAGPFRIIIPDYVDSNYSITSTASIPGGASINYIIACEEGEPVTISGTTYINYGAFVYRRNADNTFTKMPSVTIGGLTYNAYGGDGINSSGIALRYRFGAFAIPTKTFGDASFNLTAPVSDSSGAFTYTSSNTGVATVTSGGEVTIVRAGTTTITATQAASGSSWPADSISLPLVVNKIVSTLGELTVTAKRPTDAPYTLTTPTSTASSIISPITTITNQLSIITPPTLDVSAVIYGNTWAKLGQDVNTNYVETTKLSANGRVMIISAGITSTIIGNVNVYDLSGTTWVPRGSTISGTAASEYFGSDVSISANGNIIAVGAWGKLSYMGQVRIYAWSGTSWVQRGGDINGEAAGDRSGVSVSLSADGSIVAIGGWLNAGSGNLNSQAGHVRVYKYTPSKIVDISNQTDPSFGPIGWTRMGADIDGEATGDWSGYSASLSADGTTVAIGAPYNDGSGNITSDNRGHVRVYRYTPDKLVDISNQSDISFGPVGWRRIGQDIDGEGAGDLSSHVWGLSLSMYGTTVAIGSMYNNGVTGVDSGHVRVYDLSGNSWVKRGQDIDGEAAYDRFGGAVSISADANTLIVGGQENDAGVSDSNRGHARIYIWNSTASQWQQNGTDIDGAVLNENCGRSVSISADGTTAAILSVNSGGTYSGRVRVFKRAVSNEIVYTSNNTNVADACGNFLIIKGVDGTCTITSTQNGNVINGRLDVTGTTYTLQYNHFTYTSSNTSVATITPFGAVTIYGVGTTTFTATQPETWNYAARSVSGILNVSKISSTLGALTVPTKTIFEPPVFTLTAPTSTVSSIISPTHTISTTLSIMIPPPDVNPPVYGTTWAQVGWSIVGEAAGDYSGRAISMSADGTVVAIGAQNNIGQSASGTYDGHVRVYILSSGLWYQRGQDLNGEGRDDRSGCSVSLSADGNIVAIGAYGNDGVGSTLDLGISCGHVRVYSWNGTFGVWVQMGADINGEAAGDFAGSSVSLSADGTIVAIGAYANDGSGNLSACGHVRVYKYTPTKTVDVSNQALTTFGPVGWTRMGADIDGEYVGLYSGYTVALSADGTTVAIGEPYADISSNTSDNRGRIRVYRYNALKTTPQLTNPALPTFGPVGWDRIGEDIYGETGGDIIGHHSISISLNGNTVAIGAPRNDGTTGNVNDDRGHTRIYDLSGNTWVQRGQDIDGEATGDDSGTSVSLSADGNIVAIGAPDNRTNSTNTYRGHVRIYYWSDVVNLWVQRELDIDGPTGTYSSGASVSLSSDGTTVAIGAPNNVGYEGYVRVYRVPVFNKITYTSSNTSVARVLNNLLLIGSTNGTTTITATTSNTNQTYNYNTVTARLDVSGTTYTLQYNPINYISGNTSVATVSTYGTVTRNAVGTTTITAFQPETLNYASQVVSNELVVYKEISTLGPLTVPAKVPGDAPFTLTAPTSTISSIISPVNTITSTASVIVPPPDILDISYGTTWIQRGGEIVGEANEDYSGESISMSANGRVVAIGAYRNDGTTGVATDNRGHVRVYDLIGTTWVQRGGDIDGEATEDYSGSVSLSADGNIVAIGAVQNDGTANNAGHVRVYRSTPGKPAVTLQTDLSFGPLGWTRLGGDIDGEAQYDYSGRGVSISADGTIVAIGAYANIGGGHVRVYKYTPTKTQAVTNQNDASFGPVGWTRMGADIDGEASGNQSGTSISLSADGTIVAIGAPYNDGSGNITTDNRGHVRVYQYTPNKLVDISNQSDISFGPVGWRRLGQDIDGESPDDQSGQYSISLSANGTTVAIGANQNDGTAGVNTDQRGHVRVYDLSGNTWVKRGQDIDGEAIGDYSGYAVSISSDGNIVAIGAPYNNGAFSTDTTSGHVRIYFWNGSLWVKRGEDIDGQGSNVQSGSSVCLSSDGSIVAVSGPSNASYGSGRGHVRVYDISVNNAITYSSSNSSVADICANLLLIKGVNGISTITASQAEYNITARLDVSGGTYTLQYNPFTYTIGIPTVSTPPISTITSTASMIMPPVGFQDVSYGTWFQRGQDMDGEAADDYFGTSVSLSADGRTLAVGAYQNDGSVAASNIGHVRVFVLTNNTWVQRGSDIDGLLAGARSGISVSLSADGTILAIGTDWSDGTNGIYSGKVRVYRWNGSSWIRHGGDIEGERTYDESGRSIALSADGTILAIGAFKNDGSGNLLTDSGHVRVYRYNALKLTSQLTDQTLSTFGPIGWDRIGSDIDGEAASDFSGMSIAISVDGTIVAIGAYGNDGITGNVSDNRGHVRVYSWNGVSWTQLGQDIDGEAAGDTSGSGGVFDQNLFGDSVCLSADGRTVAIGAPKNIGASGSNRGHVRVYDLSGNTWIQRGQDIDGEAAGDYSGTSVKLSADGSIVAIGAPSNSGNGSVSGHVRVYAWNRSSWVQIGQDINGELAGDRAYTISLSADGTRLAIGAIGNDGTVINSNRGHARVYDISANNAITYSNSNTRVADLYNNILLIKGVDGTSIITASQNDNIVSGRLDVSGTTYTFQYEPYGYMISDASLASVSTYGTVTLTGDIRTGIISATQPATRNYAKRSVSGTLDVSGIVTVLGALTIPTKMFGDASFNLTAPTSNNPSGAFSYTSSNTAVATITSEGVITIIGIGTTTITATQSFSGIYSSASVSGSLVVNFGNTSAITILPTETALVIPTPVSNVATTYGSLWNQLGADTVGKESGDESGTSVSVSADGTLVAIGARSNTTNRGTVRVYKYNDVSWNQVGSDINGEASSDYSGQSVSLSANGRVVAIGANMNDGSGNLLADSGHVRIYEFNGTNWVQRGGDIDGEAAADQSGISVSLSADGATVAIGEIMNDGSGNALSNSGHVRVYRYNASKSVPQLTNQSLSTFGPAGWDRLGGDIDGEAINDQSGFSVSLSANGTIVAIGANFNDGTSGTVDTSNNRGHVRVYRYNASKTSPQLTDQTLSTFGPVGWDRMGSDIDGEVAADQSGFSVSLSSNGAVLAIGSPLYDASGVSNSGRVRVFAWNGSSWVQRGQNINGVALNENVGDSVSLSADGSILSVASFMKVVSYNYNSSTDIWSQIGANVPSNNMSIYSPHVYLDATNTSSYNRTTNTWTNIGSLGGNVLMTNMGTFDASDNGGSFNFNGTTNRGQITVPSTTLTSLTYVAVVKTTGLNTGYATIVEFGSDTLLFSTVNNVLRLYPYTSTAVTLTPGIWYVVAVTISSGAMTYYVNGVSVFTTTGATLNITNTIYGIGSGFGGNEYWNGKISALAVFHNRVLTASEIASVSNTFQTYRVSLSSQGNIMAIGAREYDGTTGTSTNVGVTRVYRIDTSGNYTFSSGNTAIADICGNIILPKTTGSTTIGITQSASGETGSRSGTIDFSVSYTTPTIGALTAPAKSFGDASFNLTAPTSDSSGAFTYTSSNTAVATVTSSGTVTVVGVGTTTITATQAASGSYATGAANASLVVSSIAPTIGALTAPAKNFGDAAFDLTVPTSNSDGAFTYESSDAAVATVTSGGRVTVVGAGSTTITATQAASGNYATGAVTASLVVSAIAPTIGTLTAPAKNFGASAFNLTAPTSNSGGAFTYESSDAAVATVTSGGTVTVVGAGSTTITATQAATTNYTSGSVTASLVVSAIAPTIGTLTAPAKNFGDAAFDLTAPTSNSGGDFTYESSDADVATVTSGGTVSVVGAGTTTITATQASTTNYTDGSVTASLVVSAIAPTIGDLNAPAKNFGDAAFDLTAPTSNSDGAFTYESSDAAVATVTSGGRVTVVGAGTTTITASQASTTNYTIGSVTASLVVSAIAPTIGALTAPAKNFGDASFNLTAPTSNSGGAFTYESSDAAVATVTSGGRVTVVGAGSTTITASQASTTNYTSGSVTASLVVSAIAPTIGALTAPAKNFGDASFNLTAPTSNSGGAFTYESSDAAVATVTSGGMVTIIGAGSTTITASQAASADGNYTGGSSVTASLVVSPIAPTYQSISQITKIYSTDVSFSLTSVMSGVSNSSGAYTFSTESAAIDICGGVATILTYTPSAITITATQAASGNYNGAGSTTFTVLVNRKVPSYGAFSVPAATYEDSPFSIAAYAPTTDSTGVPFTYTSSEPTVATINSDGTVITIIGQGYTTITASQDASGNYAASSTTTSFLVNRAAPTFLKAFTITNKTFGDASFSLLPFTEGLDNTDGTYHFTSSNAQLVSISEVDGVTATILAYTPTPITIYVAIDACGNYAASSTSGSLTVLRAIPTFSAFTIPAKNFRDASFNITAPTSDSSGTFTYTSSDAAVATVTSDGGVVTIVGAGSTTITATQEINGNYTTRDISASLVVSAIAPTIGALTAPAKNFGDASFNLTAPTSDSSGAFTYTSSNTAVATVTSSGTVTIVGVGTTTITATQAASADGNYTTGSVTASLVVSASLGNFTVPAKTYGDASFNLVDPETTDNTVGFTFASSNTSVATLSDRTVTIVGAGSTTITATQAATANRGELNISATLVVSKAQPVITIAAITKSYGNPSFRPVPSTTNTDTSGGSVFSFSSNNIAVVSMLDATLVRINGIGTATLSITQAASANFTNATSSVVVTVNKGISGFSASTFAVAANKTFGDAAFAITTKPISSSTGAITYSSSDEAVATIRSDGSGNSAITLVGQGTVTFTASQVESALYTADTKTSNTLTVARKTAALSRDTPSTDTITKYYGDATFTVSATNESNGAFSYSSSDPSFATIDASTGLVTIVSVGSTTLTTARAQTAQYNAASVSWTLNIARGTTTLTGLSSITRNVTVAPFSVTATSASNGAVSYALQDPTSTVLTIHPTSGLVRLLSPGSAVIVASQVQGTLYEAPTSITATITVNAAGNSLQGGTLTGSDSFANVDLSGASLANATITNTNFSSSNLENSNFNNSNVSNADMSNADLSGSTMRDATMSNVDFTSANLRNTDLSGANVRGSIFNNADLTGAILTRMDASGASFINADLRGANLSNADFTNANMTNADISGANITNVTFTVGQKLQLLKNKNNRNRPELQVSQVVGSVLLPVLSAGSAVRDVPNVANAIFKVMLPVTSLVSSETIPDVTLDISNFAYFYFPFNENEYFQIQGVKYYVSGSTVRNFTTGAAVENTSYGAKAIRLLAGSLTIIVNSQNTLASSSFVVPSMKQNTDASFSPTTLPTSNSAAPIVYSSSNTNIATINSSTGLITLVADSHGFVRFTASQVATETHESASITSNELFVNKQVDFTLPGLNQTFSLSTLASLDASSVGIGSTDATAVFYVRLSDMTNLFQYQTDAFDVNNTDASDIKYYVFHRTIPTAFHINPSHAMMNKTESAGMLGTGVQEIVAAKSLVKHDFIRYIALRLFNTHYGVDLFQNEQELQENITYLGETVQHNIETILSGISTTSANESLSYDASGNKYLTNDSSGNTNLCRELMRQIAAAQGSRFYNNGADTATSGLRQMPLHEDDSINFKLTVTAAEGQNIVTGVSVIPSRTYTIKMVLKNTVNTSSDNTNTPVTDSEMYPNSYPYSTSVVTYAPTAESVGVYNEYSPPAPIPTSRFGYNGWYYANTTSWVNVAQAVRDRVKWVVPSNAVGSSTVGVLRYIRMNLKVFNKTSLPFLVVTTQAGSTRKYTISAPNSLANGTVYSFYMNFNSYAREPATVGATNAELTYSNVGSGSFANGEVITSIAVETDGAAAASSVEFTLSSVVVGEASGEKEYGFSANV